jgi:hypothetical protein
MTGKVESVTRMALVVLRRPAIVERAYILEFSVQGLDTTPRRSFAQKLNAKGPSALPDGRGWPFVKNRAGSTTEIPG